MKELKETTWEHYQGDTIGTFYTAERKWINKIYKLKEKFPDEVDIRHINSDESIVVALPITWFKIAPKKQRNLSQEQRDVLRNRMANMKQKL